MVSTDKNPIFARTPPGGVPRGAEIKELRQALSLTSRQCAEIVFCKMRTWLSWESGERIMGADTWELFLIKAIGEYPVRYPKTYPGGQARMDGKSGQVPLWK